MWKLSAYRVDGNVLTYRDGTVLNLTKDFKIVKQDLAKIVGPALEDIFKQEEK